MAKKSKKQRKKKIAPKRPNLSPLSMLRPRLDGLMNNPEWLERTDAEIMADVQTVVRSIDPFDYLPTLVRSVGAASAEVRARLNRLIPDWLVETENVSTLLTLLDEENISPDDQGIAKEWLAQAGVDEEQLNKERESTFFDAYLIGDDSPSQAVLFIFWYTNRSRNRVAGVSFLMDYHPPWEGATKEQYFTPQISVREAIATHIEPWREQYGAVTQLDGVAAKAKVAEVLQCNLNEGIRLHGDLIMERGKIVKHILSLPDSPDGPTISLADFDTLCHQGEKPETLMFRERTIGSQFRLDSGEEITIIGSPFEEE